MRNARQASNQGTHPRGRTIVLLAVGAFAIAGCGGSSQHQSTPQGQTTSQTQPVRQTPARSNADVGAAEAQATQSQHLRPGSHARTTAERHRGDTVAATRGVEQARVTPSASSDDESSTGAKGPLNPCTLVNRAEAQSIAGAPIKSAIDAPLGPTCIYTLGDSKASITMTVESASFSQLTRELARRTRVQIASRAAYCGRLGNEMLFVRLTNGRVLSVTAPCPVAQRLAAIAVGRIAE